MKPKCIEAYCSRERYGHKEKCEKHYKREKDLNRRRGMRRYPKPGPHKAGTFDLSQCGAVGWKP